MASTETSISTFQENQYSKKSGEKYRSNKPTFQPYSSVLEGGATWFRVRDEKPCLFDWATNGLDYQKGLFADSLGLNPDNPKDVEAAKKFFDYCEKAKLDYLSGLYAHSLGLSTDKPSYLKIAKTILKEGIPFGFKLATISSLLEGRVDNTLVTLDDIIEINEEELEGFLNDYAGFTLQFSILYFYKNKIQPKDEAKKVALAIQGLAKELQGTHIIQKENGKWYLKDVQNPNFEVEIDGKHLNFVYDDKNRFFLRIGDKLEALDLEGGTPKFQGGNCKYINTGDLVFVEDVFNYIAANWLKNEISRNRTKLENLVKKLSNLPERTIFSLTTKNGQPVIYYIVNSKCRQGKKLRTIELDEGLSNFFKALHFFLQRKL